MTEIQGILLAAGAGARFGSHKLLYPLPDGEPIGLRSACNLISALPSTLAVIRQGDDELAEGLEALGLQVVENSQADLGMGGSLALAVAASKDSSGWVVALADMPWIAPQTITELAERVQQGDAICAPVHQGRRGHPVGFGWEWRDQLQMLGGDKGARHLLENHPEALVLMDTDDPGVVMDIDRLSDLNQQ
jgi:molybdenum cofactor cytidylyltransferase